MIRHIVMWKFREGTEEKANEFLTKLAALDGVIPQLKKSEVARNVGEATTTPCSFLSLRAWMT